MAGGITLHTLPAHHFSGRTLWKSNPTLWVSFVLATPARRLYLGGDSGYGPHFADIGRRFGPFDLAFLENGQYDPNWKYNHLAPEETAMAARELGAAGLLPIHAGRFVLANHPWDEPYARLARLAEDNGLRLVLPLVGETVFFDELEGPAKAFSHWWEGVE